VLSWCGVLIDIDDQRKAEEAFRESEHKLRQVIETVPGLLWSTGPDGEPTQVNQRVLDYGGIRFEDFLHFGWRDFLHPEDLPETASAFYHAIRTGTSYQAVHRLRRIDGEYRWHRARGEPLRDGHGRTIQWFGLSVDIDEAKKAEDRLRRSEAYLAEAQRLSHTGSFGWTPSTGELHWSDETFQILEYDPSFKPTIELVLQRVHPDDRAMIRQLVDETSSGEKDFDVVHRLLMPDGSVKFVHVLSRALKDVAGNLEIVGALMDVTENTLLYRDLAEREGSLVERTRALRCSEGYLAEAQRLTHIGVAAYNDTAILYGSEETFRIWGFDQAQGVPSLEAVFQRIHPQDFERMRGGVQRAVGEKTTYSIEYRIVLPDGTVKHLQSIGKPEFSASGEFVEIVATQIDVTERKHAEQALRESEGKFRDYAETASDWFWEIGPDYRFTLLTEDAFGSASSNRIGKTCWDHALDLETEPEKWRS
jgi:PAS domain S-box-containing protein